MKKIFMGIFISVLVFSALCAPHRARAAGTVTINEIMYDLKDVSDADHEWVELYNSGTSSVSLQGWKFNDGSSHILNAPPANGGQGSLSIDPGGYAILSGNAATFLADHSGFVGTVIDTVMSLNNTGATLSILDNTGAVEDSIAYTSALGGNGDGNTLSRTATALVPTAPTPGYQNGDAISVPTDDAGGDTGNSSNTESSGDQSQSMQSSAEGPLLNSTASTISPSVVKTKNVPIAVHIIASKKDIAGVPVDFSSKATGTSGEDLYDGTFVWSFGDGNIKTETHRDDFSYAYPYPGEYVVYLEYYRYSYEAKPDAFDRLTLEVAAPVLTVSSVFPDGSVAVSNTGSQEVDLYQWSMQSSDIYHTFQNHLIVLPQDSIRIPSSVSGLNAQSPPPTLYDPSGNAANTSTVSSALTPSQTADSSTDSSSPPSPSKVASKTSHADDSKDASDVSASKANPVDISATIPEPQTSDPPYRNLVFIGFGAILILAISSFAVIQYERRKKAAGAESRDEFSIEEII